MMDRSGVIPTDRTQMTYVFCGENELCLYRLHIIAGVSFNDFFSKFRQESKTHQILPVRGKPYRDLQKVKNFLVF